MREETCTSISEADLVREWTGRTQPVDRYRWTMNPAYNALEDELGELPGYEATAGR